MDAKDEQIDDSPMMHFLSSVQDLDLDHRHSMRKVLRHRASSLWSNSGRRRHSVFSKESLITIKKPGLRRLMRQIHAQPSLSPRIIEARPAQWEPPTPACSPESLDTSPIIEQQLQQPQPEARIQAISPELRGRRNSRVGSGHRSGNIAREQMKRRTSLASAPTLSTVPEESEQEVAQSLGLGIAVC